MNSSKASIADFFSWRCHPFTDTYGLKLPYVSNADQNILRLAESLISMDKGFSICGPSGSGKTTLMRYLLSKLDARHYKPCLVTYGGHNRSSLLSVWASILPAVAHRCSIDSICISKNLFNSNSRNIPY